MEWWHCRVCGALNQVDVVQATEGINRYTCTNCKTEHVLDLAVIVTIRRVRTSEEYERGEEAQSSRNIRMCDVSRDKGKTWQTMRVDLDDTNPETSCLAPGDYIRVPGFRSPFVVALENGKLTATQLPEGRVTL